MAASKLKTYSTWPTKKSQNCHLDYALRASLDMTDFLFSLLFTLRQKPPDRTPPGKYGYKRTAEPLWRLSSAAKHN